MQASCRVFFPLTRISSRLRESSGKLLCTCSVMGMKSQNQSSFSKRHYRSHQCFGLLHHAQHPSYCENRRWLRLSNRYYADQGNDPELKAMLKEITDDFTGELKEPGDYEPYELTEGKTVDSLVANQKYEQMINMSETSKDVDIDAELLRYDYEEFDMEEEQTDDDEIEDIHPISLARGSRGVYDVDELVELLRCENASDVCVISVPKEMEFVDYMVIVTGRSIRHLSAMAFYVKKLYKYKRNKHDKTSCKIEGENSTWLALDLGNIFLHLFSETRELYDLETLWTVGPEYDTLCRDTDDMPDFSWVDAYAADFKQFETVDKHRTYNKQSRTGFDGHMPKNMENTKWHKM